MEKRRKEIHEQVQLITYADSLGNNLKDLKLILDKYLQDSIKGVHILPFYPSSSDRGFSPLTHRKIDPRFGSEEDIKSISKDYDLTADLICNHVSSKSKYFQDYLKNGDNSKYRDFFIKAKYFSRRTFKRPQSKIGQFLFYTFGQIMTIIRNFDFIFHKHGVNRLVLKKIYRPREGSPFVKFKRADGKTRYLWCTFSPDQIDLNVQSPAVTRKFRRDIRHLDKLGVGYLRLDAVAYAAKRRGTNNFMIPETLNFISWLAKHAHNHKMTVIPEVHHHYKTQLSLAKLKGVDYVYDFATPFLLLHALYYKDPKYLKNWLKLRPDNSVSVLDTHDGIGVIDVEDLLPQEEVKKTCQKIYRYGGKASLRASGQSSNNVDIYQINTSYYSALRKKETDYIIARAIQLFLPGIPQIYYVGLLAGENDETLLDETKNGRDINRHSYSIEEIKKELKRPLVKEILNLCKLRNDHVAFRGKYSLEESDKEKLVISWHHTEKTLRLIVDFRAKTYLIENH